MSESNKNIMKVGREALEAFEDYCGLYLDDFENSAGDFYHFDQMDATLEGDPEVCVTCTLSDGLARDDEATVLNGLRALAQSTDAPIPDEVVARARQVIQ